MEPQDRSYFLTRAEQERVIASRCTDVAARKAHAEMATRYVAQAEKAAALIIEPRAA